MPIWYRKYRFGRQKASIKLIPLPDIPQEPSRRSRALEISKSIKAMQVELIQPDWRRGTLSGPTLPLLGDTASFGHSSGPLVLCFIVILKKYLEKKGASKDF